MKREYRGSLLSQKILEKQKEYEQEQELEELRQNLKKLQREDDLKWLILFLLSFIFWVFYVWVVSKL